MRSKARVAEANQAFDRAQHAAALPPFDARLGTSDKMWRKSRGNGAGRLLKEEGIGLNPNNAYTYGEYAAFFDVQGSLSGSDRAVGSRLFGLPPSVCGLATEKAKALRRQGIHHTGPSERAYRLYA